MTNETDVKCETAEDGDKVAKDDTRTETETETKEPKETKTVSFNRDVHVKRFGKPRESRGTSLEPSVRREPFTHLSEKELIAEANKVLAAAESITCTADHPPEKFFSLPHRKKLKEDKDRRNSDDSTPDTSPKKPLGRSTSDVSSKKKERTSLSTLFRKAQRNNSPVTPVVVTTKPTVVVKRSKSDVSDLKSSNLNPPKPIRKRSGSESEEFLKSLRNKKTQLSPIIENSPREDYFKKTSPLDIFQKQKLAQRDSVKSDDKSLIGDKKVNPVEKPPRYKSPEKVEPKPPVRTKRGKSLEKDKESSPPITETPKRKTDIKKTLLVDELDSIKTKDINPAEVKDRIKESIRKIEDNLYGDRDMIHSSQIPPDKPPLTRGHTVDQIVRILKEDQKSPPPKSHLISPPNGSNVNQPFSYLKPSVSPDPNLFVRTTSPERVPSPVNKMTDKGVVYAHVVRDNGDTGSSHLGKQTIHKTYSPSRDKYGNLSDEDEGLGYEERHKYSTNKYDYDYKNEHENFSSLEGPKIPESPIRPRIREYKLKSYDDFEPTYTNGFQPTRAKSHDLIDTYRGRGDGMDTIRKPFEADNTRVDLDFNELSHRRKLLESRINARRDRERIVGEPISRYIAETDPIYEAEKRMKATERYVNETAKYMHSTLERDGFAESSVTEDYNRYDTDSRKVKYNRETRSFEKIPKGELDRRDFIDGLEPRYNKDGTKVFPPEPEYEPPSLESNPGRHKLTADEYTEKKYKVKKNVTSSQDVLNTGQKYKRDNWFGKRKGYYASNPEIAQEREDDYANLRHDAKHAESYHNSLRRMRNKDKYYKEDLKRHDSGDSRDYYRDDRSPRRFDVDNRLVDSGIENDFRKDSGELHRRIRRHESDEDVRNTSLFLDSERRHTEDNYPSEQIYANGEYLARFKEFKDDGYRKHSSRERSNEESHLDPKGERYDRSPSRLDDKVSAKPPKATKKLSGLEKVKQLFSRDSSKKSRKEKEVVQQKPRTRVLKSPEHLARHDSDYRRYTDPEPSDLDVKKNYEEEKRYKSSREDLRHRTLREERIRGSREDLEKERSSREDIDKRRSSKENLDRFRSSKDDLRYRSSDPRDSDPERKYRETEIGRYDRTLKEDRRHTERREGARRYTSSDRDSDLQRGSDAESDRRKTRSRTAGPMDSPALAQRYRERRRLATPSPTPSPPRTRPAPTTASNWFKSLDRLTNKKKVGKDVKVEKESVISEDEPRKAWAKKPLNSPAKNLRFFGDTDQDSDHSRRSVPKSHATLRKTNSNSSTGLDEIDHAKPKTDTLTKKYYKRNLQNISEVSHSETESQFGRKPPIPHDRRSRSHSSSKTLKGSQGDLRRRDRGSSNERGSKQELNTLSRDLNRRRAANSGGSSTEGESSHQSQRSVVYLHATTVGDIPDPGQISRNRSRDDVSSLQSSNVQVRNTTKSFSIFAPWTPRHYTDQHDVHYAQKPRRSKTKEREYKKSSTSSTNLTDDRPPTLHKKSYSQTTLTRKPQSNRLSSSSTTLYRKPEKTSTLSRKSVARDKKSQSSDVIDKDGRERISRSISLPKEKKAGWFKLTNKKKEPSRVR